ncbi:MAG: molybdopterin-guanine dinucleotide biosynthesis protein B [Actinomycetota bacterium]
MKALSVIGESRSGKTTVIENIIKELRKRKYSVGSIKEIHYRDFAMDTEGTNTYRHGQAGAELVTARGNEETDILFPKKLSIEEILKFYSQDYVIMEGVLDYNLPKIVCAKSREDIDKLLDSSVFVVSGIIANGLESYNGVPAVDGVSSILKLVDLIEEKVYPVLPDFPPECCNRCGYSCRELGNKILKGEAKRKDCVIGSGEVQLKVGGKDIEMVPFVKAILRDTLLGVVKNLKGYEEGKSIEVKINGRDIFK